MPSNKKKKNRQIAMARKLRAKDDFNDSKNKKMGNTGGTYSPTAQGKGSYSDYPGVWY